MSGPFYDISFFHAFFHWKVEEKRRAIAEAEAHKHPFKPQLATVSGRRSASPSSPNHGDDPYFYAYASSSSGGNGGTVRRKSLSQCTAEHVAKQQEKLFYGEVNDLVVEGGIYV